MTVGCVLAGEVEAFRDERIVSRFLAVGPILVPLGSYYESPSGTLEVPLNARSVLAGYARLGSFVLTLGAIGAASACLVGRDLGHLLPWALLAVPLTAALAWGAHTLGRTTSRDLARRREVLAAATGHGALPGWLSDDEVRATRRRLLATWQERRRGWREGVDWREVARRGAAHVEAARLVAAIATYEAAHASTPEATALAEAAWAHALAGARETKRAMAKAETVELPAPPPARARIAVRCGACGVKAKVPARLAGRKVRCACREPVAVPAAA